MSRSEINITPTNAANNSSPCIALRSRTIKRTESKSTTKFEATIAIIDPTSSSNIELKNFLDSIDLGIHFNLFAERAITVKYLVNTISIFIQTSAQFIFIHIPIHLDFLVYSLFFIVQFL
jgi:hypothetical protein